MTEDNLLGQQLDEYRLEALLGQGGMARVYRAVDVRLGRYVAIKVIDAPFRADSDYTIRFEREARAIARLEHPNIVRLYRYGEVHGLLYMAMQYVEGANLGFVLDRYQEDQEFIQPKDASQIIQQVCLALDYAHERGVIHRDVKPSNILLDKQGQAMLTDFGLALLTEVGTRGEIFGSPYYIAPEQAISSAGAVPQSDLYALGVVLYEMFTGEVPFDAEDPLDIAAMHMTEAPPPPRGIRPDIDPSLEAVILKALAKEPEGRYPNGAALAAALDQTLKTAPAETQPSSPPTVSRPTVPARVVAEMAAHPLPPIPAAVAAPPPRRAEARTIRAAPPVSVIPRKKRSPLAFAGVGLGLVLLMLVLLVVTLFPRIRSGVGEGTPAAIASTADGAVTGVETNTTPTVVSGGIVTATQSEPTAPPDALPSIATATITMGPTLPPSEVPPAEAAPSAAEGPASYELLIARGGNKGEDSLFVVNRSAEPFLLAPLRLGNDDGAIGGAEWNIDTLESGACVTVWKDKGRPQPPDVTCDEVGERLTRGGRERFWKSTFNIYYGGELIGTCESNQQECPITITVE